MADRLRTADPARAYWQLWASGPPPDLDRFLAALGPLPPLLLAAVLRVDQRERGRVGDTPRAEDYFRSFPELRRDPEAALEVIYAEWMLREERGESPRLEDYQRDYPEQAESLAIQIQLRQALVADQGLDPPGEGTSVTTALDSSPTALDPRRGRARPASSTLPKIAGYEVLGELGRGGMGVVYKARQTRLNRIVALKMVLAGDVAGDERRARFLHEAEVVARFQHPHIVQIYTLGEHDGCPYLELEYAEGGSLADRLDGTPRPIDDAAALVETLALAIHYAHQHGVIHRDLKPANILLAAGGTPKVSDFGLAKARRHDEPAPPEGLTQTGAVLGTPNYMSPEQAAGETRRIGPSADVHALGVILYELLTGRSPFRGATPLETLEQVRSLAPIAPSSLRPKLPRDLEVICLKCLEKTPARRYGSAQALADDLRRYRRGEPIQARAPGSWERLSRLLGPGQSDKDFHRWGGVMLRTTPTILLTHGVVFLMAWFGSPYVHLALAVPMILLLVIQFVLTLLYRRRTHALPTPTTRLIGATLTSRALAGILSLEVTRHLVNPALPHHELATYPFWSIIAASFYFTLGANHWGRFYLMGLACFGLAPIMAMNLLWAPLELGLLIAAFHAYLGLHLRKLRQEPRGAPGPPSPAEPGRATGHLGPPG